MKFQSACSTLVSSLMLWLGACAISGEQPTSSPVASPSIASSPANSPTSESPVASSSPVDHSAPAHGGQVVEVGNYHLELLALPEAGGTHLDLFLLSGDDHQTIEGATVTGQIQRPDGSQQTVDFTYDADGKHYAAMWTEKAAGEYKIVILTDIKGEKVNGRFSFTQ